MSTEVCRGFPLAVGASDLLQRSVAKCSLKRCSVFATGRSGVPSGIAAAADKWEEVNSVGNGMCGKGLVQAQCAKMAWETVAW